MADPNNNAAPVTLDFSKAESVSPQDSNLAPVTLDFSNAQPLPESKSPEEQASQTRQMLVSGLTGMPTPNMTADDKASFEKGKAAGAVSVPAVAGVTTGLSALPEAASALYDLAVKHLAGNVLPGMEEEAAKQKLLEMAPKVYKVAKELGIAGSGLTLLWKAVAGSK